MNDSGETDYEDDQSAEEFWTSGDVDHVNDHKEDAFEFALFALGLFMGACLIAAFAGTWTP